MRLLAAMLLGCFALSVTSPAALAVPKKKKPAPVPATEVTLPAEIKKALERERGQTTFANPNQRFRGGIRTAAALESSGGEESASVKSADAGDRRQVQESDIYKIGAPGSKLLYLLNNSRGLQIVSYEHGVSDPRLIGRVKATGNSPDTMYLDEKTKSLFVIENNYQEYSSNGYQGELVSRVVVYDVSDPKLPRIAETLDIPGQMRDSRMVGDILYVASSTMPDRYTGEQTGKGHITSFTMTKDGLRQVETAELSLPVSAQENLGIVEVAEGGKFKYYVTAVLSQSLWGWWDAQSQVEVVDITNKDGKIKPMMVVAAKGVVERRQQVSIKDGVLIVASNYWTKDGQVARNRWEGIGRVAVETFELPGAKPDVLTADEAQYRKLHIERELGKLPTETTLEEREAAREKLMADAELGVKNRFVKTETGALRKLVSDSGVTTGDTAGQNASLRDVRFVGNSLHAAWVPANQIDPIDTFDISKPKEGVKYTGRLQFDGWIEKKIPIQFQGRSFMIGLGWIVDNVNNETGRRRPQAMLFEIVKMGGKVRVLDIAQLGLANANVWANLNDQDKFIEMKFDGAGKGTIMFQVSSFGGFGASDSKFRSGGKLIGFDLNQAVSDTGDASKIFTEGGVVAGESGWLRRVFTNTEIEKINTFSDKALGTFDGSHATLMNDPKSVAQAIHTLELARDIRGYTTMANEGQKYGVQIVSEDGYDSAKQESSTRLRMVDTAKADAELSEVLHELHLEGAYVTHTLSIDKSKMLIVTRETQYSDSKNTETYRLTQVELQKSTILSSMIEKWEKVQDYSRHRPRIEIPEGKPVTEPAPVNFEYSSVGFAEFGPGQYLLSTGEGLRHVSVSPEGARSSEVKLYSSVIGDGGSASIKQLGGKLYVTYQKPMGKIDAKAAMYGRATTFTQHFLAPLTIGTDGKWTHGAPINIPGQPVAMFGDNHLVTEDTRLMDIEVRTLGEGANAWTQENALTERQLVSLKLEGGNAVLVDMFRAENLNAESLKAGEKGFVYVEANNASQGGYRPRPYFGGGMRRPGPYYNDAETARLAGLVFDPNLYFKREMKAIRGLELTGNVDLRYVAADPATAGEFLGVLTSGKQAQIIRWNVSDMVPEVVPVAQVNEQHAKGEAKTVFELAEGGYWYYGDGGQIHFNAADRSFAIPGGMSGICQIYLTQKNVKLK